MRLTVLGCNGTYPTPGAPASGYLVESGATVWVDAGSGTFAALQAVADPAGVDAIVLSHEHADHCLDVLGFAYARRYGTPELGPVPTYAPVPVRERLEAFVGRAGSAVFEALAFVDAVPGCGVELPGLSMTFAVTDHPVPTVAVRIDGPDAAIGYTSDTGPGVDLATFFEGVDALLAEATYQGATKPWPHHLTASEAGELARSAGVARPVLTHLWPTLDPRRSAAEAAETFGAEVEVATPGMIIEY